MSVNKAIIVGRLGRDPEIRFTPSGRAVCNFDLATELFWKDRDGNRQKDTQWHKIVVWGPQGETTSKYLSKGREVYVEGEIRTRSYDDKEGNKRYVTEIVARDVRFLGGGQGERGGDGAGSDPASDVGGPSPDDDVPF
jgi:single-strand DNA-binding protein